MSLYSPLVNFVPIGGAVKEESESYIDQLCTKIKPKPLNTLGTPHPEVAVILRSGHPWMCVPTCPFKPHLETNKTGILSLFFRSPKTFQFSTFSMNSYYKNVHNKLPPPKIGLRRIWNDQRWSYIPITMPKTRSIINHELTWDSDTDNWIMYNKYNGREIPNRNFQNHVQLNLRKRYSQRKQNDRIFNMIKQAASTGNVQFTINYAISKDPNTFLYDNQKEMIK
jgi:hypothetical protein